MTKFQQPFGNQKDELPLEKGRYRLIWGALCPYAHRARIAYTLLGLEDVISLGTVNSIRTANGWAFSLDEDAVDPILKVAYLKDLYLATDAQYKGAYSVPVLVDTMTKKIVRNESADILRDFITIFQPFHKADAPDLYPDHLRQAIDEWNKKLADAINDGIYRIGFAKNQEDYDRACHTFFDMLQILEARLTHQSYVHGEQLTETDIRLYTTLVRFDAVYYSLYQANFRRLIDYPHLFNYIKRLYDIPGFGSTTDFNAIKQGYYLSQNPNAIVPIGPDESIWQ